MKTSARASKRRLKKSVRRTLGGVCLASAIMVAAIPFPDAVAYNPATAAIPVYSLDPSDYSTFNFTDGNDNYSSDTDFYDLANVSHIGEIKRATTVLTTSNNNYQLDWQYEYWVNNGGNGFVTGYNSQYTADSIDIGSRLYSDYCYFSETDLQKFYNDGTAPTMTVDLHMGEQSPVSKTIPSLKYVYTLSGKPDAAHNTEHEWISNNFSTEYNDYNKAYTDYEAHIDPGTLLPDPNFPEPLPIKRSYADIYLTDKDRNQFFCDSVFGGATPMSLVNVAYRQYIGGTPSGWLTAFVPQITQATMEANPNGTVTINGSGYSYDSKGFLCSSFDVIVGIAANAFNGVINVKNLIMAEEISIIGDSAFENSFLETITIPNGAQIGDKAFKGSNLYQVTMLNDGSISRIGAESFYGCPITSFEIPSGCTYIGAGAFANSGRLANVTFKDKGATNDIVIGRFAFYDDLALNNVDFGGVRITSIGEAAFAVNSIETGSLTDFTFPAYLKEDSSQNTLIGEYCLAGRTKLKNVTFPDNLKGALNDTIFYNCPNLECVTFGESCYNMTFNSATDGNLDEYNTMFYTVKNKNFYVRGPKEVSTGVPAETRKSTWKALYDYNTIDNTGRHVPYVYTEDGKDYYEVSDGNYLMVIEKETGKLISCRFQSPAKVRDIPKFTIPAVVGTTTVTGINAGCFEGDTGTPGTLNNIIELEIENGSQITSIDSDTFKGAAKLEKVSIGDSVQTLGKSAFEDCPKLEEVKFEKNISSIGEAAFQNCPNLEDIYFATPSDFGLFPDGNIGPNAFNTQGDKLTLHGEIASGYAPFEWATNPSNYANKIKSIRTLYKTPAPSSLSVILDNQNNLATLVDYPHLEYLDKVMYDSVSDTLVELDTAPAVGDPNYELTVLYKMQNALPLNYLEETMSKNTASIVIPEGIESIDSYGFFNDCSQNPNKIEPYSNAASVDAYFKPISDPYDAYSSTGLFNGYLGKIVGADGKIREFADGDSSELVAKGNDRITSVSMQDVAYLPDNAFDSCENLETVYLGDDIKEMGELPFSGCKKISSIACGNDDYVCNNGILYENNPDGTKTIVECLESRGGIVGRNTVSTDNDSDLVGVSEIRPRAFENCDNVYAADFTNVGKLKVIPENCFDGCEKLTEIDLPENVEEIEDQAFANTGDYTKVIVRNRNLYLADDTNGVAPDKVKTSYYVTYKDALSRKTAEKQGYIIDQTLDDVWTVKYYDRTGTELLGSEQVVDGKNAEGLDEDKIPSIEGYEFKGWNLPLKNITSDCFRIATYEPINNNNPDPNTTPGANPNTTPGTNPNNPGNQPGVTPGGSGNNGNNGNSGNNGNGGNSGNGGSGESGGGTKYKLTVNYGSGSGDYAANTTIIIEAIDAPAGKTFDKWTVSGSATPTIASMTSKATTLKMPAGDCVVTATYTDSNTRTSSGTTGRNGSSGTGTSNGNSGTRVDINKSGISNVDKAYASVKGSSDNFIVKVTESSEAANLVATALANKYGDMTPIKYFAMDISLYDATGTTKITNTNGLTVNVTMPIPDAMVQYAGNNRVGAVNGTTLEDLNCKFVTVDGIPCVSFTATHFSPYTIYVDTNNMTYGIADSTPKTGDGIHPKWFASISLFCVSMILFFKRDKISKKARTA